MQSASHPFCPFIPMQLSHIFTLHIAVVLPLELSPSELFFSLSTQTSFLASAHPSTCTSPFTQTYLKCRLPTTSALKNPTGKSKFNPSAPNTALAPALPICPS